MAQTKINPLLSLCIPIFNRLPYLERQLKRFLEDKELFNNQIELIISDNCSSDDLLSCCKTFSRMGLNLTYHRNETNIGPEGNFDWCFQHSSGKYVWLLGSDDIPKPGILHKILDVLKQEDYGLVHLSMNKQPKELVIYNTLDEILVAVSYWITYISANIISTQFVKQFDLSKYIGSYLMQVPAYINACRLCPNNAILYLPSFFEEDNDTKNNGGLNLFEVFVTNLFGMYECYVERGELSVEAFDKIKKVEFIEFLSCRVVWVLIFKTSKNYHTEGSWKILWKYYGTKMYAYCNLFHMILREIRIKVSKRLRSSYKVHG